MPAVGRRRFLARGSLAAAGASLPFAALWPRRAHARDYADLVPDPAGILDLPPGFSYDIIEASGEPMDDGYVVPGRPDAMACFEGAAGTVVLMRNHEVNLSDASNGAYGYNRAPPEAYDPLGFGGVTRVVLNAHTFSRVSSNLVLTGTVRNCAGGPSPWGWLTCEETVGPGHGYVFRCAPDTARVAAPQRIDGYGRFNHEAAAVDPRTCCCYLTEDRPDGCLYRFLPDTFDDPFTGTLQAMRVVGMDHFNTSAGLDVGDTLEIEWVSLSNPTPIADTLRFEAAGLGAALVSRGEGIWYFDGQVYVAATSGGPAGLGQIFRLMDDPAGATLQLVAQSDDVDQLSAPDNIAVAPWGQLFIAEDGYGDNFIRALTDEGEVIPFARNAGSTSELAGVCFSPDGRALFVNMQADGLTLVVTGPFPGVPPSNEGATPGPGTGDDGASGSSGALEGSGDDGHFTSTAGTTQTTSTGSTDSDTDDAAAHDGPTDEGCGCSTPGSGPEGAGLVGAVALGLRSRRRADPPKWRDRSRSSEPDPPP